MKLVTVIVPSFNSESTIAACLGSLMKQSYKDRYEIIVADSSNDRTQDIIKNGFPKIQLIKFPVKTDPGTARNAAIRNAKGDIILFTDSDCVVMNNWIQKMVENHMNFPHVAGVGGSIENANHESSNVAWAGYMAEFRESIPQRPAGYIWHNPTCNISYKSWVFERLGFFDTRLYPQEDLVFNFYLTKKGYKIFFDPDIIIKHKHRESFNDYLLHQRRFGTITAQVLKIIDLEGSKIARNKWMFLCIGYLLPFVKFFKTLFVFLHKNSKILICHPLSIVILKIGLIHWYLGFFKGVFSKPFEIDIPKRIKPVNTNNNYQRQ